MYHSDGRRPVQARASDSVMFIFQVTAFTLGLVFLGSGTHAARGKKGERDRERGKPHGRRWVEQLWAGRSG